MKINIKSKLVTTIIILDCSKTILEKTRHNNLGPKNSIENEYHIIKTSQFNMQKTECNGSWSVLK